MKLGEKTEKCVYLHVKIIATMMKTGLPSSNLTRYAIDFLICLMQFCFKNWEVYK